MRSRVFWDPAILYEQAESRTCKGCAFMVDRNGQKRCWRGPKLGRRCKFYLEAQPVKREVKI